MSVVEATNKIVLIVEKNDSALPVLFQLFEIFKASYLLIMLYK